MLLKRIFLGLVVLLLSAPNMAASVADRSPFAQGSWWDPTRSGSGFELISTADQVAVIWFTYDDSGRPVWYTAQGDVSSLGTQSWPLLRHRWSKGGKSDYTVAGWLRLTLRHPESADVAWELGGKQGTWAIQPFIVSGVISEIDHSGWWFDPDNSGWGLAVTEQGAVVGGPLFTYDASDEPTWINGSSNGQPGSVEYFMFNGACPACAYRPPTARSVGRLSFDFRGEAELTLHNQLSLPMAAGVNLDGARLFQLTRPASSRAADRQLAHFHAESALKAYLDAGMQNIPSDTDGGIAFSASPPSVELSFSTTNLQESDVDEADLVKSDGSYIYTYVHDAGVRKPVVRIAQVENEGTMLQVAGSVALASGPATPMANAGLFLNGENLVSVTGSQAISYYVSPWVSPYAWTRGVTHIEVMSTLIPDRPATRWRAQIDGHLVTSRRIGQRLYVVSRFVPYLPGFMYGTTYPPSLAANQRTLTGTPLPELLPKVRINGGEAVAAVVASNVHLPPLGSRRPMADMILINAIDLDQPRIVQTLAIIGTVDTVYASSTNLFLASSRYELRSANGTLLPVEPPLYLTDLHQIRLATDGMTIVGSASVEGHLGGDTEKSPFRLSEYQGRLRAVTSSTNMWGATKNRLTILEPSTLAPGLLKTVSYLPNAQRPQPLGKPYELIYSTRFMGDRLYAVTFRKIDPLYIVDLADSTDPRISGELEVPGFSDYLHPLPNGLLLGFGKDARPAVVVGDGQFAWYQGLQLSLFDVTNAGQPREIQRVLIGKRGSDSALLHDHHAFSALVQPDGSRLIAIPARVHDGMPTYYSGDSTFYPWQESGLMHWVLRGTNASDARLTELPSLITARTSQGSNNSSDAAQNGGRSVLFRNGTIYIGNGQFWRQENGGNIFGPY